MGKRVRFSLGIWLLVATLARRLELYSGQRNSISEGLLRSGRRSSSYSRRARIQRWSTTIDANSRCCSTDNRMKVLFLHGWQSVPGGVKPTFLKDHGHEVINPKLPDEDFEAALRIAQAEYNRHRPAVVVGSSRGGAVAMNLDSGDTPL